MLFSQLNKAVNKTKKSSIFKVSATVTPVVAVSLGKDAFSLASATLSG